MAFLHRSHRALGNRRHIAWGSVLAWGRGLHIFPRGSGVLGGALAGSAAGAPGQAGLAGSAAARAWVLVGRYSFWGFSGFGGWSLVQRPAKQPNPPAPPGRSPLIRIRTSPSPPKQSPALIPWEYMQALAPYHAKTQPPSKEPPLSPRHSAPYKRPSIKFQNKPQKAPAPKAPLKEKMKMPRTSSPSQAKP